MRLCPRMNSEAQRTIIVARGTRATPGAPYLPGVGRCGKTRQHRHKPGAPYLPGVGRCGKAQITTSWVPHICPVLADVGRHRSPQAGCPISARCWQMWEGTDHHKLGAPYLPGVGRCGKAHITTSWVPHICPVLADVGRHRSPQAGCPISARCWQMWEGTDHHKLGAPYLPGVGRCGKAHITTSWVPHICPVLADVGRHRSPQAGCPISARCWQMWEGTDHHKLGAPYLPGVGRCGKAHITTSWVPHICPVLADVGRHRSPQAGCPISARCWQMWEGTHHHKLGAPYLPGFGRCGKAQITTSWVPHICPVLADVGRHGSPQAGCPISARCWQMWEGTDHHKLGAPYLPGVGRCGKARITTSWVPHICPVLADVGRHTSPQAGCPHLPGFGRYKKARQPTRPLWKVVKRSAYGTKVFSLIPHHFRHNNRKEFWRGLPPNLVF